MSSPKTRPWTPHGLSYDPEWRRARAAEYYRRHRDRLKAAASARYHANREKASAYYQENKAAIAEKTRLRRLAQVETHRARSREAYAANKDAALERANRRRARLVQAQAGTDRHAYRARVRAIFDAPDVPCAWCGVSLAPHERVIDHIQPLARGGADDAANLCCACRLCNARKGAKSPDEWRRILATSP